MAEAKAAASQPKRKSNKLRIIILMVIFGSMAPFLMPTLTLLLIGMFPTFIALVTDKDHNQSSATAIGALNSAGVTPFIIDLWMKGQTMDNVFQILREPSSWLVMLGAAGVGQLIVFAVPQAMASLTLARAELRLKTLKHNLEQLKSTWGPEVATTKPLDKINQRD